MPQLEGPLYGYLSTDPGVSGLVGTRVFPNLVPEGTILPAITYHRITSLRDYTYDPFTETRAWVEARVQIDSWHHTALGAMEVGEAVMLALSGYHGDMGGLPIGRITSITEADRYDEGRKLHGRTQDYWIAFEEAITLAS